MRYVLVSILSGILFGVLDGVINANPLAQKLFQVYKPIARSSVNMPAGLAIDLVYGFVMAAMFMVLYKALPGSTGLVKGMSFGLMVWFFRVVMSVASSWMMFELSPQLLMYSLITGLVEMIIIGVFFGLLLKP